MRRRWRRAPTAPFRYSAAAVDGSQPSPDEDKGDERASPDLETLLRRFWKVAAPYWSSDDKSQARLRLASVFALTLATTGISVGFNFLGRDFYNALANKDQEQFTRQLLYYLGGFAGGIPFFILRDYARETLSLRWRSWMTSYYMERYSVDLISFSNILYGIYPPLFIVLLIYSLGGTAISVFLGKGLVNLNFMQEKKEADFRYGLVRIRENAESIAFYGGEGNEMRLLLKLFRRAFENLSQLLVASRNLEFFTSGYRYLIQILPAAVVAPMYFSGKIEFGVINQSVSAFNHILSDFSLIVYQFQAISAFSAVIDRLGEFNDVLDANQTSDNSSVDSNEGIKFLCSDARMSTTLGSNGRMSHDECDKLLVIQNLTLQTPNSRNVLITDLSLEVNDNDHILVMGPSGCGKTSLLRALAGLWSTGNGNIIFYVTNPGNHLEQANESKRDVLKSLKTRRVSDVFFLPQKPYMVLGTLRQQLLYPTWIEDSLPTSDSLPFLSKDLSSENVCDKPKKPTVEDLTQVLELVRLGDILSRFNGLDSVYEWSSVLSLGEQQRLAFARMLLSKPKLVLLDEATSALDDANEVHLYTQIEAAGMTYISIGHRRTLYNYHNKVLYISKFDAENSSQQNWKLESIDQTASSEEVKPAF